MEKQHKTGAFDVRTIIMTNRGVSWRFRFETAQAATLAELYEVLNATGLVFGQRCPHGGAEPVAMVLSKQAIGTVEEA